MMAFLNNRYRLQSEPVFPFFFFISDGVFGEFLKSKNCLCLVFHLYRDGLWHADFPYACVEAPDGG